MEVLPESTHFNYPKISVIIPTFNRERFIIRAVESVLSQDYPELEVIVVDDGSTDGTRQALKPYLPYIRYIRKPNGGVSSARNRGMSEATGEWIGFLDSDDMWSRDKLELQLSALRSTGADVCFTRTVLTNAGDDGEVAGTGEPASTPSSAGSDAEPWVMMRPLELLMNRPVFLETALIRRDLLAEVGVFDESLIVAEDTQMVYRLARHTERFAYVEKPCIVVERSSERKGLTGKSSATDRVQAAATVEILRDAVERSLNEGRNVRKRLRDRLAFHLYRMAVVHLRDGERQRARICARESLLTGNRKKSRLKAFILLFAPAFVFGSGKRKKA